MVSDSGPRLDPDYRRARTDDQKRERETAILLAARREFEKAGFHGFRMRSVATRLHISKAALYGYHRSKATILADLTRGMLASWATDVERALDSSLTSTAELASAIVETLRGRETVLRLLDILEPLVQPELTDAERDDLTRHLDGVYYRVGTGIRQRLGGAPTEYEPSAAVALARHILAIVRTSVAVELGVAALLAGTTTGVAPKSRP